jgi:parallel beta-helix repeat protein
MLTFAFNIKPAKAEWTGTVYIRADGSIDPPDAPIITYDKITYTLTDVILSTADGIIVQRNNIIINGAFHEIFYIGEMGKDAYGIKLYNRVNVTITNTIILQYPISIYLYGSSKIFVRENIISGAIGIQLEWSSTNYILRNNIAGCGTGILLYYSSLNNIYENNIESGDGIFLISSSNNMISRNNIKNALHGTVLLESFSNKFYHNNFLNNAQQIYDLAWHYPSLLHSVNV